MVASVSSAPSLPFAPATADARAAHSRSEARIDTALVRRFNTTGDEEAFAEIVARYRERMFTIAQGVLHNHADAEEVAQDTFIRAHRGLAEFRGDSSLATWLYRIAINLSRNRYWYYFRRCRQSSISLDCPVGEDNDGVLADLVATTIDGPAQAAVAREFTELIQKCMTRLNVPARQILTLRALRNRSYDEIALELGINVGTVKSRLARARESLRLLLAGSCPEFGADLPPAAWFDPVRTQGGILCAGT